MVHKESSQLWPNPEAECDQKAAEVVGRGTMAPALVCAGPFRWLGLAGISIATAYAKANQQASSSQQLRGA